MHCYGSSQSITDRFAAVSGVGGGLFSLSMTPFTPFINHRF